MTSARQPEPPQVSEAQLEILRLVWDRGEATVSDVWKELSRRRSVARNTVQTTMTRMRAKGLLAVREEGNTHYFSAARERGPFMRQMVDRWVATAFDGAAEGLVFSLLEKRGLTSAEARRIRALIAEAEGRSRRKRR